MNLARAVVLTGTILAAAAAGAHAQEESADQQPDTTTQVWGDYHIHYFTAKNREFYGDGGARFLSLQSRISTRPCWEPGNGTLL